MTFRKRLSTKQREALYQSEAEKARIAGLGDFPVCAICKFPILPGRRWHVSHEQHKPHWLGGEVAGISHEKCNLDWNHTHDTPKWAKNERIRKRHLDLNRPRTPLPGGRHDQIKKTMRGEVVDRRTGQRWGGWK